MELSTLKAHIIKGNLQSYYIFTGPEVEVMRIYLRQMAEKTNSKIVELDNIAELAARLNSSPLTSQAFIFVLRECKEILSQDKAQDKILQARARNNAVSVFIYDKIDTRTKLYKRHMQDVVEFDYLSKDILIKYMQKEVTTLSISTCTELIDICNSCYRRILLEIDKLKRYADGKDINAVFKEVRKSTDLFFYVAPEDRLFDLVEAVLTRKQNAMAIWRECVDNGVSSLLILASLYNATKQLMQVQAYNNQGDILNTTGLTAFQVKMAKARVGRFPIAQLVYFLKLIREAEKGIKTGLIEESMAVPYVITGLMLWKR